MIRHYIALAVLLLLCVTMISYGRSGQNDARELRKMTRFLKADDIVQFQNGEVVVWQSNDLSPGFFKVTSIDNDFVILRGPARENGSYAETIISASAIHQISRIMAGKKSQATRAPSSL